MAVQTQAPESSSTDRIERRYEFKANRSRMWRALTDASQFSTWFRIKLDGPFVVGQVTHGMMINPGWEQVKQNLHIQRMDPETHFTFRWHPYPIRTVDYDTDPTTLVEFTLEEISGGTALTVVESGFDQLPLERRLEAFSMHGKGWDGQARNLEAYVA
jgi:uncharacterized protein YndB with AHSA1/START domain